MKIVSFTSFLLVIQSTFFLVQLLQNIKTIFNFIGTYSTICFSDFYLCLFKCSHVYNRQIDREEFKKVMGLMRAQNRQGASHRDGRRFGLKVAEPVENGGLLEYFFGKDGKTCLQHERFVQFLRDLHDEVCVYFSNSTV